MKLLMYLEKQSQLFKIIFTSSHSYLEYSDQVLVLCYDRIAPGLLKARDGTRKSIRPDRQLNWGGEFTPLP